jgi:hypothetical protein
LHIMWVEWQDSYFNGKSIHIVSELVAQNGYLQ